MCLPVISNCRKSSRRSRTGVFGRFVHQPSFTHPFPHVREVVVLNLAILISLNLLSHSSTLILIPCSEKRRKGQTLCHRIVRVTSSSLQLFALFRCENTGILFFSLEIRVFYYKIFNLQIRMLRGHGSESMQRSGLQYIYLRVLDQDRNGKFWYTVTLQFFLF